MSSIRWGPWRKVQVWYSYTGNRLIRKQRFRKISDGKRESVAMNWSKICRKSGAQHGQVLEENVTRIGSRGSRVTSDAS
jgi:hypothetical protein